MIKFEVAKFKLPYTCTCAKNYGTIHLFEIAYVKRVKLNDKP